MRIKEFSDTKIFINTDGKLTDDIILTVVILMKI